MPTIRKAAIILCTCALTLGAVPNAWADDDDDGGVVDAIIEIIEESIGIMIDPSGHENDGDCNGNGC